MQIEIRIDPRFHDGFSRIEPTGRIRFHRNGRPIRAYRVESPRSMEDHPLAERCVPVTIVIGGQLHRFLVDLTEEEEEGTDG